MYSVWMVLATHHLSRYILGVALPVGTVGRIYISRTGKDPLTAWVPTGSHILLITSSDKGAEAGPVCLRCKEGEEHGCELNWGQKSQAGRWCWMFSPVRNLDFYSYFNMQVSSRVFSRVESGIIWFTFISTILVPIRREGTYQLENSISRLNSCTRFGC